MSSITTNRIGQVVSDLGVKEKVAEGSADIGALASRVSLDVLDFAGAAVSDHLPDVPSLGEGAVHAVTRKVTDKLGAIADLPVFEEIAVTGLDPKKAMKNAVSGLVAKAGGAVGGFAGSVARKLGAKNFAVTIGSGDKLDLRRFSIRERLSSLFHVDLVVGSNNPSIEFDAVVGQAAKLEMSTGVHDRYWMGICNHIEQVRHEPGGLSTYHLSIVPKLWFLTQRKNYCIHQQISELDIVLKMLDEWGIDVDSRVDKAAYKKRKYRVQYNESDYAFLSRLLEDVGITFWFEQVAGEQQEKTMLVLSDAPHANSMRGNGLSFLDDTSMRRDEGMEFATAVRVGQRVRPGKYTMRDHDYRMPPEVELLSTASKGLPIEARLERFQYVPGAFLFGTDAGEATPCADDKGKTRTDEKEAQVLAEKRLDAKRGGARVATFETNAHDLAPGIVVSIYGHAHGALEDGKALLVVESLLTGARNGKWSHHCEVRGTDIPFRPELVTPRPKTQGVECALVVGPSNEEIHCDEFGRVRVQFYWDRNGQRDENSSCWIHVSQPWGGSGYGATNLPRIGQEVLVDFVAGDPDRPIIVGRVYTNLQKTPYKLPENKTQSGWKSNSTGGGGGYNEISFEDAKGKELVNMQAERDLTKLVKNDETVTIGHDRTKTVGNDDSLTVGHDRTCMVGNNETITIGVDETVTIGGNHTTTVEGDQRTTVTGSQFNTVKGEPKEGSFCGSHTDVTGDYKMTASKTAFISAPEKITLKCENSSITLTPTEITIEAGGKAKIVLNTAALMQSVNESKVTLDADAKVHSSTNSDLELTAEALLKASGGGQTKCTGDIECLGTKATIASTSGGGAEFTADAAMGGANVSIEGKAKVGIAAPAVNSSAKGTNEISGGVVKIN